MYIIRKFLCWLFAISSLVCLWNSLRFVLRFIHQHSLHQSLDGVFVVALFPTLALIYGIAWWTVWKKKRSGKAWGAVACLTYILFPLWGMIISRSVSLSLAVMLVVGILILLILLWPAEEEPSEDDLPFN